ncbi:MAG: hypothetical protein ACAH80_13650 [Alphaproteobacteria bacterium]
MRMRFFFPVVLIALCLTQPMLLPAMADKPGTVNHESAAMESYAMTIAALPPTEQEVPRTVLKMMQAGQLPVLYPDKPEIWVPGPERQFTPLGASEWAALSQSDIIESSQTAAGTYKLAKNGYRILAFFTPENWHGKWEASCEKAELRQPRRIGDKVGKDASDARRFLRARFIIFGPGIFPADMIWEDPYTIKNTISGASLRITPKHWDQRAPAPCFNLAFAESGNVEEFNWKAFYEHL